ncbi:MAG: redoxin domain-containing protein [candidate division Zixibacteria bacterium]|nr:redoxin domain-containing protein [candidate division Zixibacteria bacterium]
MIARRKSDISFMLACWVFGLAGIVLATQPKEVKSAVPGQKGTVLLFVASLCPCTDAHRIMVDQLVEKYAPGEFRFYAVFPNLGENQERAEYFFRQIKWDMNFIIDATGKLAQRYKATRTPQAVVLNPKGKVLFNGPIDDANLNQGRVDHAYLKDALGDIRAGKTVKEKEVPPLGGCWIVADSTATGIVWGK